MIHTVAHSNLRIIRAGLIQAIGILVADVVVKTPIVRYLLETCIFFKCKFARRIEALQMFADVLVVRVSVDILPVCLTL